MKENKMAARHPSSQVSELPPEFVPGKLLRIARQKFQIVKILQIPKIAFTAHFQTTRDGVVVSERYAQVYQVPCLASKIGTPFNYFLEVYYWTDSGIEKPKLKEKRKKLPGAIEEPDGTAVLTLEKIASSKDVPLGKYNLIYIWQVEKSLDPKGPLLAYKQEFSEYLEKHLPPSSIITLAGGHKYRIESFLSAEGAFGTIFKATLLETNKTVVLKFQETRAGVHEALALREFYGHPGIVDFLQASEIIEYFNPRDVNTNNPLSGEIVFQQKQGKEKRVQFYCVVAEFVEGKDLNRIIRDSKEKWGTRLYDWFDKIPFWGRRGNKLIGLGDCVSYIEQLSDAVDFIHHKGYVHLDIKPHNVMLDDEGNIMRIVDMGSVSKIGAGVFAFGQGNHAAPEVKEYLVNSNRTTSRWIQRFMTNIQSTWQVGSNIPEDLLDSLRSSLTEEQKKLHQQCETESQRAYQKISTQSDVFSVGAMFLSLISRKNPRQVAMPDENAPTKVGRILMYENELPLRRRIFIPTIRKAMSLDIGTRYQTCLGLKQAIQSDFTQLTFNELLLSGISLFVILSLVVFYLLKLPIMFAAAVFGVPTIGLLGWRILQSIRKPILSAIQLKAFAIAGKRLMVSMLLLGILFISVQFGKLLYAERAFFTIGINQEGIHQTSPLFVNVSPSESTAVDMLVFNSGFDAYQEGDYQEAKDQFQAFLRMYQSEFGLSDTQIDEFDLTTAEQLAKYVSENPNGHRSVEILWVMIFIEPDRLFQTVSDTNFYETPDNQLTPTSSVPTDTPIVLINHVQGDWYLIWYERVLYYAQLEGIQK